MAFDLHRAARRGDIDRVRVLLRAKYPPKIDERDRHGQTALMYALGSPKAGPELVHLLIESGADVRQECERLGANHTTVAVCLHGGDPNKLAVLLEHGADVQYVRTGGY